MRSKSVFSPAEWVDKNHFTTRDNYVSISVRAVFNYVESDAVLSFLCFVKLCDWSKKKKLCHFLNQSNVKKKANPRRVFPRSLHVTCISFAFLLADCVVLFVVSDSCICLISV